MTFLDEFMGNKSDKVKLKNFFQKAKNENICESIVENANGEIGLSIWNSALECLSTDEKKIIEIVKEVLPKLNRDQLSTRVLGDFYSRLCIQLPQCTLKFAVELGYHCESAMQIGDPRACYFKDILPCILQILAKDDRSVTIGGESISSIEYHQRIIGSILNKPFNVNVLTSTTSMFQDIPLDKQQTEMLLGKICDNVLNVEQQNISGLALACFNLALFNKLVIPILAFDNYFYQKRYKKKFVEIDSENDMESIDETSEKGIIETEENVIFHFQHVTEFTSIEKDIVTALKPLAYAPKFIISPFIATILVSFAKMSASSVSGNLRLPQSVLLPFMKQIFKNNERHRLILHQSAWARSVDQFEPIDIDKLLKVLQENTCKLGQNVALNGFIGLTFMLLKTKEAPALNTFAVQFLNELVKQRQEFASDIMKIVVKMLFSETNKAPIIECFSIMIQNRALPIDRCEEALKDLIENLTELELDTALAIESVIYSAITKSMKLRDLMSEKMRTAMYQNKPEMRKLAVYSFCVMLKKVTKPSMQGTSQGPYLPSQNISMMSLLSQSQLPSTEKVNMRRVSVLVLEILGILRKCFSHSAEVRITLYKSLLGAVEANPFIIPNVLELVETYFRDYFDSEEADSIINFKKAFKRLDHGEIVVMDHLGKFLSFFIGCIETANDKLSEDENVNNVQITKYRKIIEKLIEKIIDVTMEELDIFSTLDLKASATITQFLNCLEALMAYCCHDLSSNGNITRIIKLFEKHKSATKEAKKLQENCKKGTKRGKNQTANETTSAKIDISFECVWDLKVCGDFLKIVFEDNANEKINEIKQNVEFVRFVLKSTSQKVLQLTTAPDNLKVRHSRAIFSYLKKHSAMLFKQIELGSFENLFTHFDAESAVLVTEAFNNAFQTMDVIYNTPTKWLDFLKKVTGVTNESADWMIMKMIKALQQIINWAFDPAKEVMDSEGKGERIVLNIFTSIEILFRNFQHMPNAHTRDAYNWLLAFCKKTEVEQKNLHIINKVLFQFMSQQDASGAMMEHIANKISKIYGYLEDDVEELQDSTQNDVKTINKTTVDQAFNYFTSTIKKQIEDVEFCIMRMNSFNAYIKIPGQDSRNESVTSLKSLELSCVIKLKHLGTVVSRLCNTRFNARSSQIDQITKVGISYFTCLGNLMKHFSQHFEIKKINFEEIPMNHLMKETKKASLRVYALSPYVEDIIEDAYNRAAKETGAGKKKKPPPVKEFKNMSRLVLTVEKFGSIVQKFDKQSKQNFSRFIHAGEVRDFRIKLPHARKEKAPAKTPTDLSDEDTDATADLDVNTNSDSTVVSDKEEEEPVAKKKSRQRIQDSSSEEEEEESNKSDADDSSHESPKPVRRGGFETNLKKISATSRKRKQ